MKTRQKVRRVLIIAMFALLPITLYYFSPVLSISAASSGIISGSIIVFALLFISSLFLGRLFCGWVCPAGGAQEIILLFRRKAVNRRRIRWVKWLIWAPWIVMLVFFILQAGGVKGIDLFYQTRHGISVTDMPGLIAYVSVVAVFFVLAVTVGRRAGCHVICWMAPFMMIGRSIRNAFGWPSLRLVGNREGCEGCGKCSRECPMSIDVKERVQQGRLETRDCILCGSCVDTCPRQVIRYSFSAGIHS
jgi:ferredoxin-type protein NapH